MPGVWKMLSHNVDYKMSSAIAIQNFNLSEARPTVRFYSRGVSNVLDSCTVVGQTCVRRWYISREYLEIAWPRYWHCCYIDAHGRWLTAGWRTPGGISPLRRYVLGWSVYVILTALTRRKIGLLPLIYLQLFLDTAIKIRAPLLRFDQFSNKTVV